MGDVPCRQDRRSRPSFAAVLRKSTLWTDEAPAGATSSEACYRPAMGAGSIGLIWYACCCSFFAFAGITAAGLVVAGRSKEARVRAARAKAQAERVGTTVPTPDDDQGTSL